MNNISVAIIDVLVLQCIWCGSKSPYCLPHPGGVIPSSSFCPL